jgi:hypothetical protein
MFNFKNVFVVIVARTVGPWQREGCMEKGLEVGTANAQTLEEGRAVSKSPH